MPFTSRWSKLLQLLPNHRYNHNNKQPVPVSPSILSLSKLPKHTAPVQQPTYHCTVQQQGITCTCMAAFQRPGDRAASAFGIAFLSDRIPEDSESASAAARQQRLQQQTPAQRQVLANGGGGIGPHQQAVLHAVENHATTVLASDDAAGERLHLRFVKGAGAFGALQYVSPQCSAMPGSTADLTKASGQSSTLSSYTDE